MARIRAAGTKKIPTLNIVRRQKPNRVKAVNHGAELANLRLDLSNLSLSERSQRATTRPMALIITGNMRIMRCLVSNQMANHREAPIANTTDNAVIGVVVLATFIALKDGVKRMS
jgi:hypothetical protein